MKAVFKYLSTQIDFDEKSINILTLENKTIFRNAIISLLENNEQEQFVFSDNSKILTFSKSIYFENNILIPTSTDRKLKTKINSALEQYINEHCFDETAKIAEAFMNLKNILCEYLEYDFYSGFETDAKSIIKILDFEPRLDGFTDSLEALAFYFDILKKYLPYALFIVADMLSYFSYEELVPFFQTVISKDIKLLLIESSAAPLSEYYHSFIVDKDLCSIS